MKRKKHRDQIEMVLLYGLEKDSEKSIKIAALLEEIKVPIVRIEPEQLNQTLGYLCKMRGFEENSLPFAESAPSEECLIMRGFTQRKIEQLLNGLKLSETPIALKAIVTEYNRSWKLIDLLTELKREHEEMKKYQK